MINIGGSMYKYLVLLLLIVSLCSAGRFLTNGDFEQELNVGWTQAIVTATAGDTINRATDYDPDPDYEAMVKKYDAISAQIYQTVNIPTTDLQFSVNGKLYAYEYNSTATYWAAAAICLRYLDQNNNLLGETRICYKSPHCPWTSSDNLHLLVEMFPNMWINYSFNLNTELANLPGVNPANIRKVQVALYDTTDGC